MYVACGETVTDNTAMEYCKALAKALGKDVEGKGSYAFAGKWSTKGCYFYTSGSGTYEGHAWYGTGGEQDDWTGSLTNSDLERIPLKFNNCLVTSNSGKRIYHIHKSAT